MSWLAIDAGTSVLKTVLFDNRGREVSSARATIAISRPHPRYAEQSMEQVWNAVLLTVELVLSQSSADRRSIEGIVTTAQGDGVWLVDAEGLPTGPAILWNDGRATRIIERWRAQGVLDEAFRHSGSVSYPGLPNAIWRWLDRHTPERLQRSRWSLTCNGWLHLQLTGSIAADISDASNPFFDLVNRWYSPELLSLFEANAYSHLLPPVTQTPCSPLRAELAQHFGLTLDTPVLMAPYDIAATATGCGSIHAGDGCLILGTTICAEMIVTNPKPGSRPSGTTLALDSPHTDQRLFLRAMPTLTGCEALDWLASTLKLEGVNALSRLAATAPPGASNLVFLPYLSPAGERSPFLAPSARGTLLGLSLEHTGSDLARAVVEGLSFVIRECLAAASEAPPRRLTVCGGGSRSDLWCQMIADVCACEVLRPLASELGARGAFLHALAYSGTASSLAHAVSLCPVATQPFQPRPELTGHYEFLFERFLRLREQVAPTWELMRTAPDFLEEIPTA